MYISSKINLNWRIVSENHNCSEKQAQWAGTTVGTRAHNRNAVAQCISGLAYGYFVSSDLYRAVTVGDIETGRDDSRLSVYTCTRGYAEVRAELLNSD